MKGRTSTGWLLVFRPPNGPPETAFDDRHGRPAGRPIHASIWPKADRRLSERAGRKPTVDYQVQDLGLDGRPGVKADIRRDAGNLRARRLLVEDSQHQGLEVITASLAGESDRGSVYRAIPIGRTIRIGSGFEQQRYMFRPTVYDCPCERGKARHIEGIRWSGRSAAIVVKKG